MELRYTFIFDLILVLLSVKILLRLLITGGKWYYLVVDFCISDIKISIRMHKAYYSHNYVPLIYSFLRGECRYFDLTCFCYHCFYKTPTFPCVIQLIISIKNQNKSTQKQHHPIREQCYQPCCVC